MSPFNTYFFLLFPCSWWYAGSHIRRWAHVVRTPYNSAHWGSSEGIPGLHSTHSIDHTVFRGLQFLLLTCKLEILRDCPFPWEHRDEDYLGGRRASSAWKTVCWVVFQLAGVLLVAGHWEGLGLWCCRRSSHRSRAPERRRQSSCDFVNPTGPRQCIGLCTPGSQLAARH